MELIVEDGVTEIKGAAYEGNADVEAVYIPASVVKIGTAAFRSCVNLHDIQFEDGARSLEIGESAFEGCTALREMDLPARANRFLRACFKNSGLERMTIGHDGDFIASQDPEKFSGCPAEKALEAVLEEERMERVQKLFRRNRIEHQFPVCELLMKLKPIDAAALRSLYDCMVADGDFEIVAYGRRYGAACRAFGQVADWEAADAATVKSLVGGREAKHVAAIDKGEIFDREWSADAVQKMRSVCAAVKSADFDEEKLRKAFYQIFTRIKHHAAFHRLLATAHPDDFIQIPAIAALVPLYTWLTKKNPPTVEQADWCELSAGVRSALSKLLPGVDIYRAGAFAWYMADAIRNAPTEVRIRAIRNSKAISWMRELRILGV